MIHPQMTLETDGLTLETELIVPLYTTQDEEYFWLSLGGLSEIAGNGDFTGVFDDLAPWGPWELFDLGWKTYSLDYSSSPDDRELPEPHDPGFWEDFDWSQFATDSSSMGIYDDSFTDIYDSGSMDIYDSDFGSNGTSMDDNSTDDSGPFEEMDPPTTTLVLQFTAILVSSNGCTLLDEDVAEAWVNWYAGAIVGVTSKSSPAPLGCGYRWVMRAWHGMVW